MISPGPMWFGLGTEAPLLKDEFQQLGQRAIAHLLSIYILGFCGILFCPLCFLLNDTKTLNNIIQFGEVKDHQYKDEIRLYFSFYLP